MPPGRPAHDPTRTDNGPVVAHRVLVVEDDHGLRDLLARGLRSHDFQVTTAADGESAMHSVTPA